jgi:hypothetical protein
VKKRRRTREQLVRQLREADRLLAEDVELVGVRRRLEVSVQRYQPVAVSEQAVRPKDLVRLKQFGKQEERFEGCWPSGRSWTTMREVARETGRPGAAWKRLSICKGASGSGNACPCAKPSSTSQRYCRRHAHERLVSSRKHESTNRGTQRSQVLVRPERSGGAVRVVL